MARLVSPLGIVVVTSDENARRMMAAGYSPVEAEAPKATKAAKTTRTRSTRARKAKGA